MKQYIHVLQSDVYMHMYVGTVSYQWHVSTQKKHVCCSFLYTYTYAKSYVHGLHVQLRELDSLDNRRDYLSVILHL